jgi:antitoxin (DNA-binding transcriptional repressor) of toxin-antitoxin stability system
MCCSGLSQLLGLRHTSLPAAVVLAKTILATREASASAGAVNPVRLSWPDQIGFTSPHACLSALLLRVEAGEEIVLAPNGRPCARLVPMEPRPQRRLGFLKGIVDESFFAPLPESELQAWEH